MRRIVWPSAAEDPDRHATRAWVLAWEALNAYAAGDNAQTRRLHRTHRAIEAIGLEEPVPGGGEGDVRWKLRPEGGEVILEEAEWQLLKLAIEALRTRRDVQGNAVLTGAHTRPLLWLDELLEHPPEVGAEET